MESGNINLLSILNKTLKTISTAKLSGAINMYNSHLKKITVMHFIKDNLGAVMVGSGIIILLIFSVILYALRKSKIAERRAKEAQKQAEVADATKSRFLSNMSHDMRTPINGIIGMLEIMERQKDDPAVVEDCVKKIDSSSKLLLSLINDVLDMAKLESDATVIKDESINISKVCEEVAKAIFFQAEDAGITLTEEHDAPEGVYVLSSALYLKKIFINLFSNAVKYNKKNGSIHMSMKTLERTNDKMVCEFKISDTGIGMMEDFIKNQLFVPFAQAGDSARSKYNGTGLGMPMVKGIVDKMGGNISVESKIGEGTTFTVVIPFKIDHNHNAYVEIESTDCSIKGMKLLLAEDNELNAEIAVALLEDEGAFVFVAENGKQAVEMFNQN